MNKIYGLITTVAMAFATSAPLHAEINPDDIIFNQNDITFADWTTYTGSGNSGTVFVNYNNSLPSGASYAITLWNYQETEKNVWLASPSISLDASKDYAISLEYQTWNPLLISNFNVYLSDEPVNATTVESIEALTPIYTSTNLTGSDTYYHPLQIDNIQGSGEKYLIFHVSGPCQGRFSLANIKMYEAVPEIPAPQPATAFKAVANPDGLLEATLSWTLPTENIAGDPLTGEFAIEGVNIYRDGEKVNTVEGAASTFLDTEATGLTAGVHTYTISVVANSRESEQSEAVSTTWIGPWSYEEKTLSVSNSSPETAWSFRQNSNNAIIRAQAQSSVPGGYTNAVQLWAYSAIENYDGWISSPSLNLIPERKYKLSFLYRFNPNAETQVDNLKVWLSPSRAAASEEDVVEAEKGIMLLDASAPLGSCNTNTPWEKVEYKGFIPTESPLYLNVNVSGTVCKGIFITGLVIEEYEEKPFAPAAPSNLTATAAANQVLEVALSWSNPTLSNDGDPLTADQKVEQVYVYRDDFDVPAFTLEGNLSEAVDNEERGLTPGAHSYKIKVVVADAESDFSNEASVVYVGPLATQTLPFNPSVTDITNEEFRVMWSTFNMAYGLVWTNRPAGLMYMNNTAVSADSWLISAPLSLDKTKTYDIDYHITTNSIEFVPDMEIGFVDSTQPTSFVASQKIKFGEDATATLRLSNPGPATRTDASYYLAIHDATQDPESSYNMILSSVGVKDGVTTGLDNISLENAEIININDVAGHPVVSDIQNLPKGLYIISLSNGSTVKIIK